MATAMGNNKISIAAISSVSVNGILFRCIFGSLRAPWSHFKPVRSFPNYLPTVTLLRSLDELSTQQWRT